MLRAIAIARGSLDPIILEAVDEGLLLVGTSVRSMIYFHVEKVWNVKREDIPAKLDRFHMALQEIFKDLGSRVIEGMIAKELHFRIGLRFQYHNDWTIIEYVEDVKKRLRPVTAIRR